jgi:hypothetical protein
VIPSGIAMVAEAAFIFIVIGMRCLIKLESCRRMGDKLILFSSSTFQYGYLAMTFEMLLK